MNFLQIKTIIVNIQKIKLRNIYFMLFAPGDRSKLSVILAFGRFFYGLKSSSSINILDGSLILNSDFSKPNPFMGVLKMYDHSELNVENGFVIHAPFHIVINHNAKLNLGSGYINKNAKIRCLKEISIGKNVAIGEDFTIWDSDAHIIKGKENETTQKTAIGNNVWIGINVTVLKGVTIGDGAVIEAGAVVTRNIPSGVLAGGVPAKVIRQNIEWT